MPVVPAPFSVAGIVIVQIEPICSQLRVQVPCHELCHHEHMSLHMHTHDVVKTKPENVKQLTLQA